MNTTLKETLKTLVTNMKAFLSANYPTTNSLTGSATIATKNSNTVVIKSGISESAGVISNSAGADITLADVASTGSYADLSNKPAIKAGQGENSIIEGDLVGNSSTGTYSHVEGFNTTASGYSSHAEGQLTIASGPMSHAEGAGATASGDASHAEGGGTTASGSASHAEGWDTEASGPMSHAEGQSTTASAFASHAEGSSTTATGDYSHTEGNGTIANHKSQHVFGEYNRVDPSSALSSARGTYVEIVGNGTKAASRSNARTLDWSGNETLAGNLTIGGTITANGQEITPAEPQVQADWNQSDDEAVDYIKNKPAIKAGQGEGSIIEGYNTTASGDNSHAEGQGTKASGPNSHTEGNETTASGTCSHAEGDSTTASGACSHAEGYGVTASGFFSHAEGAGTTASGSYSHTEGAATKAIGGWSHAEGYNTTANSDYSHAEGQGTTASGENSHAEGAGTTANHKCQHVFGENNIADPSLNDPTARGNYVEIVGNGATSSARSNARTLDWSGNETLAGNLTIGGTITTNGQQILPQKQADWNQTTSTESDYIKNKPTIKAGQGENSIIEGDIDNNITGNFSHAEGAGTTANGIVSHAEGSGTTAIGNYSHAEGKSTTASGQYSHAEGYATTASGYSSHAEGRETTASGQNSHAEGYNTTANHKSQHVFGEYNIADPSLISNSARGTYIEIVGNGADGSTRSNARTLDWSGNEVLSGTITANGINLNEEINLKEPLLPATPTQPESKFLNANKQWVEMTVGSGGYASNLYMTANDSDIAGYKEASYTNDFVETIISQSIANEESLMATYLFTSPIGVTTIDEGTWRFSLFAGTSSRVGETTFGVEVFVRAIDGTETILFKKYSNKIVNEISTDGYKRILIENVQPNFTVNETDRLGYRVYAKTTSVASRTLYFKVGGENASFANTPIAIRHSQLRDLNGDSSYLHITSVEKAAFAAKQDALIAGNNITIVGNTISSTGGLTTVYKSITIENPTASENMCIFYTPVAMTITEIRGVITGATSVSFKVVSGTSRNAVTTEHNSSAVVCSSVTTGDVATITTAAVAAGSWVAVKTSAIAGAPSELVITLSLTF